MYCVKGEDRLLSELASLYESRGYTRYKPGCFEDYSLYLENIDFLISKNVIAFGGAEGRLLALRPDVTLSVISHLRNDEPTSKLFYAEKVYRRSEDGGEFREINQTGVEVVGDIDDVCQTEVAMLISRTLASVSGNYLVDVSHMGYTEGLMEYLGLEGENKERAYGLLRGKNVHDFAQFASQAGLGRERAQLFASVALIDGDADRAVVRAKECAVNDAMEEGAAELEKLVGSLRRLGYGDKINVNFSIANNADYYNGLIFNGYIDGVPRRVLSGGRYDKLLKKMGRRGGAIGFALYLGELERHFASDGNFVDELIVYDDATQLEALSLGEKFTGEGRSVRLSRTLPSAVRFGRVTYLAGGLK